MSLSADVRLAVRQRAIFACEYCGVSEADTGGELTVDHYQPRGRGGTDALANLLYSCQRCNQYKAAYWASQPGDPVLWNPRQEPRQTHLFPLPDGTLYPVTPTGAFTIRRLRLNRAPLVAYRLRKQYQGEELALLKRYRETLTVLRQLHEQQDAVLQEQRELLEEQRALLGLVAHLHE